MIEIKFTLDATPALIGAVRDLAGAIHAAANNAHLVQSGEPCDRITTAQHVGMGNFGGYLLVQSGEPCDRITTQTATVESPVSPEKEDAAENVTNLPAEDARTEAPESVEETKKRKSRSKKAPSESNATVAPAIETPAEPEPSTISEDPAPEEETLALDGTDPLAGKGQTGEILAELTRKAIGALDALGVDRSEANRRIRDYCARNDIKYPTFPALLQAVGYAEAIAICKGV